MFRKKEFPCRIGSRGSIIYGGQLARRKSLNYALIFPENILLTLFFMSMNTIFTYFRICENSYK